MKHLKSLLILTLLTSCAKVEIPDVEWCGDLGPLGASCFTTLSKKERDLTKEQWDKERMGMICASSDGFAKIKTTILKFCEVNKKRCEFEMIDQINKFDDSIKNATKAERRKKKESLSIEKVIESHNSDDRALKAQTP